MEIMNAQERLHALVELGKYLSVPSETRTAVMEKALYYNAWFTLENQEDAIQAIATAFLSAGNLHAWMASYGMPDPVAPRTVGLVMAGNLPLVGFHDVLCVFAAGHRAQIKLSEKDAHLLPHLLDKLAEIDARTTGYFEFTERLAGFNAVIATGSNNSARYFETYFGVYPHIIRKNRNGVAVLSGQETVEDMKALGRDIFQYYGLGCRNVSKIYVPQGYDFQVLLETLHDSFKEVILNAKYKHNFDYNYALYLINKVEFKMIGCLLLTENDAMASRIAGLHYAYYTDIEAVEAELHHRKEEIQCIVALPGLLKQPSLRFGQTQSPGLRDYPDGADTMQFLVSLS